MNEKKAIESKLQLLKLCFDKLEFVRLGEKNESKLEQKLSAQISGIGDDKYKVTLELKANKEKEYEIVIVIRGVFRFMSDSGFDDNAKKEIIKKNTVAIMMPYVRSQLTLMTAQPNVDTVVMPPLNIVAMFDQNSNN